MSVNAFRERIAAVALLALFGIIHPQFPLYHANQNQYYLHGLARAGVGLLREDWLARTTDPTPVFSGLVFLIHRYLDDRLFYFLYLILLGLFAYSLLRIGSVLFAARLDFPRYSAVFALLALLGSPLVGQLSTRIVGFDMGSNILLSGVALQSTIEPMLQPSTFGVFLVFSMALFVSGRAFLAVVASAFAATIHPTYILGSAVLVTAYVIETLIVEKQFRKSLAVGALALLLVLPIVVYVLLSFRSANPEMQRQAHLLLMEYRIPWHALPSRWMGTMVFVRMAVVIGALFIAYRERQRALFVILGLSSLVAATLTVVQVLTYNPTLAVLLPWRLSVIIVPVASMLVLTYILCRLYDGFEARWRLLPRAVIATSVIVVTVLAVGGAWTMYQWFGNPPGFRDARDVIDFVRWERRSGQVYLIPVLFEEFRLAAGAPVYVDFNSIPYRDVEFLEWYRRIRLATQFFEAKGEVRCRVFQQIRSRDRVSHVVIAGDERASVCPQWRLLFGGKKLSVYQVD